LRVLSPSCCRSLKSIFCPRRFAVRRSDCRLRWEVISNESLSLSLSLRHILLLRPCAPPPSRNSLVNFQLSLSLSTPFSPLSFRVSRAESERASLSFVLSALYTSIQFQTQLQSGRACQLNLIYLFVTRERHTLDCIWILCV
jgi:hypothetical protein